MLNDMSLPYPNLIRPLCAFKTRPFIISDVYIYICVIEYLCQNWSNWLLIKGDTGWHILPIQWHVAPTTWFVTRQGAHCATWQPHNEKSPAGFGLLNVKKYIATLHNSHWRSANHNHRICFVMQSECIPHGPMSCAYIRLNFNWTILNLFW